MTKFSWAHSDEVDLKVTINWGEPVKFKELFDGQVDEEEAYYYAIIGKSHNRWKCFYIGKVYDQYVSTRHLNADHIRRREELERKHPKIDWHLTLGVPTFNEAGRITRNRVDIVEGLLIYSHWHKKIANRSKINSFHSNKSILVSNHGFVDPFKKLIAYGVMIYAS